MFFLIIRLAVYLKKVLPQKFREMVNFPLR
jgi:hypothetical protein